MRFHVFNTVGVFLCLGWGGADAQLMKFTIGVEVLKDAAGSHLAGEAAESTRFQLVNLGSNDRFDPVEAGDWTGGDDVLIPFHPSPNLVETRPALSLANIGSNPAGNTNPPGVFGPFSIAIPVSRFAATGDYVGLRWFPGAAGQSVPIAGQTYGEVSITEGDGAWILPTTTALPVQFVAGSVDSEFLPGVPAGFTGLADKVVRTATALPIPVNSPNDRFFGDQHPQTLSQAWFGLASGRLTGIAILSTGVDVDHPDLVSSLLTMPLEIPANGIDDDGNSFIDDSVGWDFAESDSAPDDVDGDGTHAAGIVAAGWNNAIGVAGLARNGRVLSIRIDSDADQLADAINYVLNNRQRGQATVETLLITERVAAEEYPASDSSLGLALNRLEQTSTILTVVAAGDEGRDLDAVSLPVLLPSPQTNPSALFVTAVDSAGDLLSGANFSALNIDLTAPGEGIISTGLAGSVDTDSSTVSAAALVAGSAAMVQESHGPLPAPVVRRLLLDAAEQRPGLEAFARNGRFLRIDRLPLVAAREGWYRQFFGANHADLVEAHPDADANADGVPNRLHRALGTDPRGFSRPAFFTLDGRSGFEHRLLARVLRSAYGANAVFQISHELANPGSWQTAPESMLRYRGLSNTNPELLEIELVIDNTVPLPAFFRLNVSD